MQSSKRKRALADGQTVLSFGAPPLFGPNRLALPRKRRHTPRPSSKAQLYIDAGQRTFDQKKCSVCGMLYTPGLSSDEAAHAAYCAKRRSAVAWPSLKGCRVVREFKDGAVVLLRSSDAIRHKSRLAEISQRMDMELGFAHGLLDPDELMTFIYVSSQRAVGVVVIERFRHSDRYTMTATKEGFEVSSKVAGNGDRKLRAMLGIRKIWVHSDSRRTGVATALLDAARTHAVYGYIVAPDQLAFSQPTSQGHSFAEKYTKCTNYLVYSLGSTNEIGKRTLAHSFESAPFEY